MFNFLHNWEPRAEILTIGSYSIHWYGLLIALGAVAGVAVALKVAKEYGIDKDFFLNFLFYVLLFAIIGDRLYFVAYDWQYYSQNLWDIPKIWEGGLAIHGAIIGALAVLIYFVKKHKINGWKYLDAMAIGTVLGQAIGRWGNYFNQELFGTPTGLPWGIPIEADKRPLMYADSTFFHPTFLYESLLNLLLFGVLYYWHTRRRGRKNVNYGTIALTYLIGYSCIRIFTETLRTDYSPYLLGMRVAMVVSIGIAILALAVLIWKIYKKSR